MDPEKKEFGGWWMWVLGLIVVSALVFGGLRYAGVWTDTVVEREVYEQSYQRQEAVKSQIATFEAQKVELEGRLLNPNLDEGTRANIQAQISSINVQLRAAKEKLR